MLEVKYFCHGCMEKKGVKPELNEYVSVSVRSRQEGEDIRTYVDDVRRLVSIHHSHRGCTCTTCDLAIPLENDKQIGCL